MPIPLDKVDAAEIAKPHVLDLGFIRNFMWVIGPISSLFDFLTFYIMLVVLHADEKLFQTGWFVESLCTQVLVIFIIRTRGNPLKSTAHPLLILTSLTVVAAAILLPFTSIGTHFGFVAPPIKFYLLLGGMVIAYLIIVQVVKQVFYRWSARRVSSQPLNA
jgi:Mg2+-importing ATPase